MSQTQRPVIEIAAAAAEESIRTERASFGKRVADDEPAARVADVDVEAARGLARASFGKRVGVEVAGMVALVLAVQGVAMSDAWREALTVTVRRIIAEEFKRIDDEGGVRP